MNPNSQRWKTVLTWICRLLLGGVFTFSGLTKGIDPFGSLYKFREYLSVIGVWVPDSVILSFVIVLCAVEFLLGVFMLLGCYRRSAALATLLMMVPMLVVTAWIWISDPINDCGCFGDALKISNAATFFKNVLLTAAAVWLVIYNLKVATLVTPYLQWTVLVAASIVILGISLYGYEIQPIWDFRPYPVATRLSAEDLSDEDRNLTFVYRKGDLIKEFSISDSLPSEEDGWEFVERHENESAQSGATRALESHTDSFRFYDEEGEDVTADIIEQGQERRMLMVLMPEIDRISKAEAWRIEELVDMAMKSDVECIAVVAGNPDVTEQWKELLAVDIPFYSAEDTAIKMLARGNPAVVYLDNNVIEWKSTLRGLFMMIRFAAKNGHGAIDLFDKE